MVSDRDRETQREHTYEKQVSFDDQTKEQSKHSVVKVMYNVHIDDER